LISSELKLDSAFVSVSTAGEGAEDGGDLGIMFKGEPVLSMSEDLGQAKEDQKELQGKHIFFEI
jgi:hypothetical protein